jgi:hypothetical protein
VDTDTAILNEGNLAASVDNGVTNAALSDLDFDGEWWLFDAAE